MDVRQTVLDRIREERETLGSTVCQTYLDFPALVEPGSDKLDEWRERLETLELLERLAQLAPVYPHEATQQHTR